MQYNFLKLGVGKALNDSLKTVVLFCVMNVYTKLLLTELA